MCLGVPAKILELLDNSMAIVDVDGNQTEVSLRLTPEAKVDDYVLMHAGFAMDIIDPTYAEETMLYLKEFAAYD